ncbi:MAG: hypothetical protein WCA21_12755 [Terracidiphilus sp.]
MNNVLQVNLGRHVYRIKRWKRVLSLVAGGLFTAFGVFFGKIAFSGDAPATGILLALFFLVISLYFIVLALRSRLVFEGTRLTIRDVFRERSVDLKEIEGFRTYHSRYGSYVQLRLKGKQRAMNLRDMFDQDDAFRAWFKQIPDLDAVDRDKVLADIARQEDLGTTAEERLNAIKPARLWNNLVCAVSAIAAIALYFGPVTFEKPSALILALTPLAMLFLVMRSPQVFVYGGGRRKAEPRADILLPLLPVSLGLALWTIGVNIVSLQPLFPAMTIAALAYIAAFFTTTRKDIDIARRLIVLLIFAVPFGYGLTVAANVLADNSKPSIYIVPVLGKHITNGDRSTSYYLDLAPWGPVKDPNKIEVPSNFYGEIQENEQVCLSLHSGRLHAAWYRIANCPN